MINVPINSTEIIEERTLRSKTFDLGNGKRKLINIVAGIVHFDDAGVFKDIDTTIRLRNGAYRVEDAPFKLSIPTDAIGFDYISRQGGNVSVRLTGLNDAPVVPSIKPRLNGNELWLDEVVPGLALYFKVRPAQVQIWKIIKNASAPHILTWRVTETNVGKFTVKTELKGFDNQDDLPTIGARSQEKELRRAVEIIVDAPAKNPNGTAYTIREELTNRSVRRDPKSRVKSFRRNETIYPVLIDQDITENIAADVDDGTEMGYNDTWNNNIGGQMQFGIYATYDYHGGVRFRTVAVPAGATIDLANLIFEVEGFSGITPRASTKIYSDAVADAALWSNSSRPSQVTKSSASTTFQPTTTGSKTVTVTSQVQEIVDAGFVSGNDMRFAILNQETGSAHKRTKVYDYYYGTGNVAQLQINYTTGGGATGKSNPLFGPLGGPLGLVG